MKKIKTLKSLIDSLEKILNIPKEYHIVAVFENNQSNKIIGWIVPKIGVEDDYPIYSLEELIQNFKPE